MKYTKSVSDIFSKKKKGFIEKTINKHAAVDLNSHD